MRRAVTEEHRKRAEDDADLMKCLEEGTVRYDEVVSLSRQEAWSEEDREVVRRLLKQGYGYYLDTLLRETSCEVEYLRVRIEPVREKEREEAARRYNDMMRNGAYMAMGIFALVVAALVGGGVCLGMWLSR